MLNERSSKSMLDIELMFEDQKGALFNVIVVTFMKTSLTLPRFSNLTIWFKKGFYFYLDLNL